MDLFPAIMSEAIAAKNKIANPFRYFTVLPPESFIATALKHAKHPPNPSIKDKFLYDKTLLIKSLRDSHWYTGTRSLKAGFIQEKTKIPKRMKPARSTDQPSS